MDGLQIVLTGVAAKEYLEMKEQLRLYKETGTETTTDFTDSGEVCQEASDELLGIKPKKHRTALPYKGAWTDEANAKIRAAITGYEKSGRKLANSERKVSTLARQLDRTEDAIRSRIHALGGRVKNKAATIGPANA